MISGGKKLIICAKSSRIQKWGKRYNEFTNQKNILTHKWFKNATDFEYCVEFILMIKLLIYELLLRSHKKAPNI